MASIGRRFVAMLFLFWWHSGTCQSTDVDCLREIKRTVRDPINALSSWTFTDISSYNICSNYAGVQCLHPSEIKVYSLSLAGFSLQGPFPQALSKCSSLTGLDLSVNDFTGPVPDSICSFLPYLVQLDLSVNAFSGPIPAGLGNCSYLNSLYLQRNDFTGYIPGQIGLLDRLSDVNFSSNQLVGQIPYTFSSRATSAFQGNPGLCGHPLSKSCKSSGSGTTTGLIAGVAVGGTAAALAVASLCVYLIFLKKQPQKGMLSNENKWIRKIKDPRTIGVSMFEKPLVRIRLSDLMAATNAFSKDNIIGMGRTGIFYKATLRDGSVLAIKRLSPSSYSDRQFISEMETLGRLRHRNLVPLLGFCVAASERLLVYKHMINGTLHNRLHEADTSEKLDWPARLKVALGAARGLAWLHHSCNPRIIHRNISACSILLDEDFDARITDFGLAQLMNPVDTHVSTVVNGDFGDVGYVAPEYVRTLVATVKGDVYSFGVVLLELVTSRKPIGPIVESDFNGNLVEWVGMLCSSGNVSEVIDKSLLGKGADSELLQFLRIARSCVLSLPKDRPSMYDVFQLVKAIAQKYQFTDQTDELPIVYQTADVDNADELIITRQNGISK
ncbi:hypothetical protein O6H91_09G109700 [Diphasiastrum complanatum]|uniref:Uncharacterized protein n=2 Tax=Diphasiastrum complanatum TaxID=34168 RepID=A0ACC2CSX9_DIPCM|nr:hypothetical protein O6H91_Y082400 [Diphasiastrum complanatum]KAJ7297073.1 hypothetical protein O6H91_Y082400 [Diphasiastrum complanatum]KAJ7297074.1 hypothetical protein O6H91_Y082400 [Diphasiastrum complanatum]KAJ7297075.1 hypothetical protein O6H91_Y082400 [Diphasiastrum complanatum]KAJ7297076.1 hypothetical protein O6H91_Y082400 [Diphasiastrum complanatum]